jgi:hypothetical protein
LRRAPSALTRRAFLQTIGAGAAAWAVTCLRARRSLAAQPSIKRVVIVHAPGGVRWTASFDGQLDVRRNPWGVLPWSVVARGRAPAWGFSRLLVQKPLWQTATDWTGTIYPYLASDDPAHYNVAAPLLPSWQGAPLPSLADLAASIAVVRVGGNPGGAFELDHASASRALYSGSPSGQAGLVTVLHDALRRQLGAETDRRYPLPAVTVAQPGWSLGTGELAPARPIFLTSAAELPSEGADQAVAPWGSAAEAELDRAFAGSRCASDAQAAADFINDKAAADAHVAQLIDPALKLYERPSGASPALGTLVDGATPLTNDMLAEVFGLSSAQAPAGDLWFDIFAGAQSSAQPTWSAADNSFGLSGALAVRLLQVGAPIVSITVGAFDTHSCEVVDPSERRPGTTQVPALGRLLAGLAFALARTADPSAPGASLWDSTVVFACSEFGRGGDDVGSNGFNSPNGSNGGGSDHDAWSAWPILGGPVGAGGQLIADSQNGGFFHQNRIFSTLLKGLGVDDGNNPWLPYGTFAPIPGLVRGV